MILQGGKSSRITLILLVLLSISTSNISTQTIYTVQQNNTNSKLSPKKVSKLASSLQVIVQDEELALTNSTSESTAASPFKHCISKSNKVLVELIAKSFIDALQNELEEIPFEVHQIHEKIISGYIAINQLESLNMLESLKYARPVYRPITHVGITDSQGDVAQYSDLGRSTYNVDGDGIRIGVLSDSYDNLNGANAGILSGDLPGPGNPNGYTTPVTVLKEYSGSGTDEARGIAEIIHDVAPGAEIYARTAFEGEADFARGIKDLFINGCEVIVDDVVYFTEPFFQDGVVAQAVDSVVSEGGVYFSAAGNMSNKSYESAFSASGFAYNGAPLHDFDPGAGVDYSQQITVPNGATLYLTLQWDDPFGSLPGSIAGADTAKEPTVFQGRALRTVANHVESMMFFVPLALVAHHMGLSENAMVIKGVWLYLIGRAIYPLTYWTGLPYARTLIWAVSIVGILMLFLPIMGWA